MLVVLVVLGVKPSAFDNKTAKSSKCYKIFPKITLIVLISFLFLDSIPNFDFVIGLNTIFNFDVDTIANAQFDIFSFKFLFSDFHFDIRIFCLFIKLH